MMPDDVDHYAVLELAPGSPIAEVKSQYRRLAKKYHPDLHGNDAQSQAQFRRVHAAYAFLADAARKADYDAYLRALAALAASASKPSVPPRASSVKPSAGPAARPAATRPTTARPPSSVGSFWGALGNLRMTRAAWLGATAAVILFLLGVGLSVGNDTRSGGYGGPAVGVSGDGADYGTAQGPLPDPVPIPDSGSALDPAPFAASTVPLSREVLRPAKAAHSLHVGKSDKATASPAEALLPDTARSRRLPVPASEPPRSERRFPRVSAASPVRWSAARAAARRHARDREEAHAGEAQAAVTDSAPPALARMTPLPEHTAVPAAPSLAPLRVQASPAPAFPLKAAAPTRASQAAPFRAAPLKAASSPNQGFIVWEK